jgi:AAA domain, putative AbiEii toxin, Type IV TA system
VHCVKIRFEAYKRLAETSCNTDGRILAFVGSNESGKSSMLEGLVWLTNGQDDALPVVYENRSQGVADRDVVVEAEYELAAEDLALIDDLDLLEQPTKFVLQKRKDGTTGADASPYPKRNPQPFEAAASKLEATHRRLHAQFAAPVNEDDDEGESPADWANEVLAALKEPDRSWSEEAVAAAEALADWLEDVAPTSRSGNPRDPKAAELVRIALGKSRAKHPRDVVRQRLLPRVPKFVLFEDEDRALSTVHQINDEASRRDPQPALANLLRIADLDLQRLWGFVDSGDVSSRETLIDEANENLQEFFTQAWNQSNVSVRLKVSGDRLEVYLKELGRGGPVTNIEERSDGLRTFVALAAFLASQELGVPPVLLIDEAETHLHYDAQADLVGVLLKQVNATQVFYTTHSPGCLPGDLGTGIRLLRRDTARPNASQIRHDFWTNEEPGFAPLLYAMGASAAAFSACRRAVLAEGAADMILLPTLIRMAIGKGDLDYQVAPGLSNAHTFGMRVEEVAARVVYLTDGDVEGQKYRQQLVDADVDASRIFSLPDGWASEDLIDREVLVEIVNTLLPKGAVVTEAGLRDGQPIVKALQDWGKREKVKVPGHVAIAYGLVNRARDLKLASGAETALVALHEQFVRAFL